MTHSRIWLGAALACVAVTLWSCNDDSLGGSASGSGGSLGSGNNGSPGGSGSGSGGSGSVGGGAGGSLGTGGCNSIDYPGPVLNVFDALTGAPVCDATFSIVAQTDAGWMLTDAFASPCSPYTCPVSYDDAGAMLCPFYLAGLGYNTSGVTVDVSAPGYKHTDVPGVAAGRSGCVPPFFPASHLDVNLIALSPDASATD
jgi:hypothetical protein